MVKKDEPVVPVDISGTPLAKLTPKQAEKAKLLEYERVIKSSNKGVYRTWTREEKHILVTWAQDMNYDLSMSEFKDVVEGFKFYNFKTFAEPIILRSLPKIDNTGRELDVLCVYCGRIHSYTVPVGYRGKWEVMALCVSVSSEPLGYDRYKIDDTHIPVANWEKKWLTK